MEIKSNKRTSKKRKVSFYPYTYVRVLVMKSKLLKKDDFETMMKMEKQELINFLQSKGYVEFASLANDYNGIELVERSVKKHMVNVFTKLRRVSNPDLLDLIDLYLMRYDLRNLKTVIRAVKFKQDAEHLIVPAGKFDMEFYKKLLKKEKIDDIFSMLRNTIFYDIKNLDKPNIFEIENSLDQIYFNHVFNYVKGLPKQSELFKNFMLTEIHVKNVITILKVLKDHLEVDFSKVLFPYNGSSLIKKLKSSRDIDEAIHYLRKSTYYSYIEEGIKELKEKNSLLTLERGIRVYLLKKLKHMAYHNILSINVILNFMFEQDLEVKNILVLFKAKTFDMDNEFIRENMIF